MAWKPEVKVQGDWSSNALVFASRDEASNYAADLWSRWTLCDDYRAVEVEAPVTHEWSGERGLKNLETGTERFPARSVSL